MIDERWELGSDYHYVNHDLKFMGVDDSPWDRSQVCWAGVGRDAIRLILQHGMSTRGWQRFWLPSYYCQEVVSAVRSTGIECLLYSLNPLSPDRKPKLNFQERDVVMAVNHFGLYGVPSWLSAIPPSVDYIEDHTHDPWSIWANTSNATFAFASLRKTLPLAEGAPIWSPAGQPLPDEPKVTTVRSNAVRLKSQGMMEKAKYLSGGLVTKDAYRSKLLAGEAEIASGEISGITETSLSILRKFPLGHWRAVRKANAEYLRKNLITVSDIELLECKSESTPFSVILLLPNQERRETLRRYLIAASVYPAILWPLSNAELDGITKVDQELADRMLSVHCDGRYSLADMKRLADLIIKGLRL